MAKLTKQQLFIEEYMTDFNATRAAKAAGYSEATAYSQGQRLLKNVEIQVEINKRCEEVTAGFPLLRKQIVERLQRMAFSDIGDYLEYRTAKTVVGNDKDTGEPIIGYKTIIDLKDSQEVDTSLITEVQETRDGFRFKRMDSVKALELLAKFTGLDNADREEILKRIERLEETAERAGR